MASWSTRCGRFFHHYAVHLHQAAFDILLGLFAGAAFELHDAFGKALTQIGQGCRCAARADVALLAGAGGLRSRGLRGAEVCGGCGAA